jgi:hypothetical protein
MSKILLLLLLLLIFFFSLPVTRKQRTKSDQNRRCTQDLNKQQHALITSPSEKLRVRTATDLEHQALTFSQAKPYRIHQEVSPPHIRIWIATWEAPTPPSCHFRWLQVGELQGQPVPLGQEQEY